MGDKIKSMQLLIALILLCRSPTISVVELQGVSQGNSDSGSERLRLPTASLTIVFYHSSKD